MAGLDPAIQSALVHEPTGVIDSPEVGREASERPKAGKETLFAHDDPAILAVNRAIALCRPTAKANEDLLW